MWSLSNAFTSVFKKLDPIPQFTTAKLGGFLAQLFELSCDLPLSRDLRFIVWDGGDHVSYSPITNPSHRHAEPLPL
jgi:hypothetical protein